MNGLLDDSGSEPWDRVWSIDEMRGAANNWSLACDAGVSPRSHGATANCVKNGFTVTGGVRRSSCTQWVLYLFCAAGICDTHYR